MKNPHAKGAQKFSRNVKMVTDEDAGKKTRPAVSAAVKSFKDYHSGKADKKRARVR